MLNSNIDIKKPFEIYLDFLIRSHLINLVEKMKWYSISRLPNPVFYTLIDQIKSLNTQREHVGFYPCTISQNKTPGNRHCFCRCEKVM